MNTKNEIDIRDIVDLYDSKELKLIETTVGLNGYPNKLKFAIIGFKDFKEAEQIANAHDLRLVEVSKKDGWQLWNRGSYEVFEAFEVDAESYGDNFISYDYNQFEDEGEFIASEVTPRIEGVECMSDIIDFVESMNEIWEEIEALEPGELVITNACKYEETINKQCMIWSHDSSTIAIAAIK